MNRNQMWATVGAVAAAGLASIGAAVFLGTDDAVTMAAFAWAFAFLTAVSVLILGD